MNRRIIIIAKVDMLNLRTITSLHQFNLEHKTAFLLLRIPQFPFEIIRSL